MNDEIILHGLKDAAFAIKESQQRFEEIEKIITQQYNGWFDHIDNRLNEVDEILNRIIVNNITSGRKPHKCPVCSGNGDTEDEDYNHCFPCDGNGIVWG